MAPMAHDFIKYLEEKICVYLQKYAAALRYPNFYHLLAGN
jgi:hypothetical protein